MTYSSVLEQSHFNDRLRSLMQIAFLLMLVPGLAEQVPAQQPADASEAPSKKNILFEDIHVAKWPRLPHGYRTAMGDMLQQQDGRLLLSYVREVYTPISDDHGPELVARYSSDQGKTWGKEFILVPKPRPLSRYFYCHPSFLRLDNGDVLLSYIYSSLSPPWYGHNYYRRSTDDGETWGDQLILTPLPGKPHVHNDKLIQLSTGRVLAATAISIAPTPGGHSGVVAFSFYSDDQGYTWHKSTNVVNSLPIEAQEPAVVELKDGRLLMMCRTYNRFVLRSYSSDQGVTWSEGEPVHELALPNNSSALNLDRIPSTGDLIMLRCAGGEGSNRTPFVSVISRDEGNTWESERVIQGDPEEDYGYPSLNFVDDMAIISYHRRDGVYVARIGIDWFYGK